MHPRSIDFAREAFAPVFVWPAGAQPVVLDLSGTSTEAFTGWTIGRYNERRGIYRSELFSSERNIHVGIDLGGPVGWQVHLPYEGTIAYQGYNAAAGDYGNCVITRHELQGQTLWMLFGHLDSTSVRHPLHTVLPKGYVIGRLGAEAENGGWPPHLHFQLSYREPTTHDLPGVISDADRAAGMLRDFPDPRFVLGPIYTD